MQRITISIDDALLEVIDRWSARRGYASRSEAMRDMVRAIGAEEVAADDDAPCVAALSYVYEHGTRDLPRRLTDAQHDHHDLSVATMHVHLDREECLEVSVLRGRIAEVRALSDSMVTQRGVRLGRLHIVPLPAANPTVARHRHEPPPPAARERRRKLQTSTGQNGGA
jgi:CopG family transcriptional regulator, nickel-responsive regulator